jgi:hypothetical protein
LHTAVGLLRLLQTGAIKNALDWMVGNESRSGTITIIANEVPHQLLGTRTST